MKRILELLHEDIKNMTVKDHIIYWIMPSLLMSIMMIFYFSGNPTLVEIICPSENREWGLLENLQLVIILYILVLSIYATTKKIQKILKWGFFFIALFTFFVFLEEINYGEHFAQLIGTSEKVFLDQYIPEKPIHNQGNNAKIFKRSVYLLMAMIFVIAPFLKSNVNNSLLRYLIPKPRIIIIAILAIIVDLVPRLIVVFGIRKDGGLGINIGEFSEVMVYYIFAIYLRQLIYINKLKIERKLVPD